MLDSVAGPVLHCRSPMESLLCARHPQAVNLNAASGELLGERGLRSRLRQVQVRRVVQAGRAVRGVRAPVCYLNPIEADKEKEEARIYRRTVYDHKLWLRHRSSTRHARHILTIASSRVILSLGPPVFSLTLLSASFASYNYLLVNHLATFPEWAPVLHISALPFQLTSPALALLLVFRTNSSYGRFDEARKIWGSNVNRTRDIVRQALSWVQAPQDAARLSEFVRYVVAYPFCLKDHIAREEDLRKDLEPILEAAELETLLASAHRPNHAVQMMSAILAKCQLSDIRRSAMDQNLTQFHDNTGACERIFKTPIPVSYTRLTSRFLVLWHIALPLCLWDSCKLLVVPATMASAAALFCIDEVGVLIEEPFSILPLMAICQGIQGSIKALVSSHADWFTLRSENGAASSRYESRSESEALAVEES